MADRKEFVIKDIDVAASMRNQKTANIIRLTVIYIFLTLMAVMMIFPFYWMIISSLKTMAERTYALA